jgi:hypothetical protein
MKNGNIYQNLKLNFFKDTSGFNFILKLLELFILSLLVKGTKFDVCCLSSLKSTHSLFLMLLIVSSLCPFSYDSFLFSFFTIVSKYEKVSFCISMFI